MQRTGGIFDEKVGERAPGVDSEPHRLPLASLPYAVCRQAPRAGKPMPLAQAARPRILRTTPTMRMRDMAIAGRTALITGGSQGIGEAIVRRLAAEGITVAVVASSSIDKAQAVCATLPAGRGLPFACDVRDAAAVGRLIADAEQRLGGIDILVNNAGVFYPTPTGATEQAAFDRMIDVNLKGTWHAINAVAPAMQARRKGWIVNIGSVVASMGFGGFAVYCATKAAIVMMTRALAIELAPHGISVNCLSPGNTATPMNEFVRFDPSMKPMLEAMTARTPSGQTYSSAEDMANIVAFMVSDAARAMHGANILADEGFSAGL
jgi:3-oxoacyl-[acyl-carrier protein] reductase